MIFGGLRLKSMKSISLISMSLLNPRNQCIFTWSQMRKVDMWGINGISYASPLPTGIQDETHRACMGTKT